MSRVYLEDTTKQMNKQSHKGINNGQTNKHSKVVVIYDAKGIGYFFSYSKPYKAANTQLDEDVSYESTKR